MSSVLVLISPHKGEKLSDALLGEILSPIPHDYRSRSVRWLAAGHACEVDLFVWDSAGTASQWDDEDSMNAFLQNHVVDTARSKHGIDAAVLPAANRRKRLLIADMDSTIIEQECIDELADFAGKRDEIAG
ncbi:MAG: hypothetical protein ACX939_05025, partial [Hyphococcus sp.]